jgi:electron transport complex protein RnfG
MMVGVSADLTCTGISITDSSETAGLGAVASQSSEKGEAFRAQFVGQSGTVAVTKEGGSVDAISGATITSKAVCRGVTAALAYCQNLG